MKQFGLILFGFLLVAVFFSLIGELAGEKDYKQAFYKLILFSYLLVTFYLLIAF